VPKKKSLTPFLFSSWKTPGTFTQPEIQADSILAPRCILIKIFMRGGGTQTRSARVASFWLYLQPLFAGSISESRLGGSDAARGRGTCGCIGRGIQLRAAGWASVPPRWPCLAVSRCPYVSISSRLCLLQPLSPPASAPSAHGPRARLPRRSQTQRFVFYRGCGGSYFVPFNPPEGSKLC